MLWSLLALALAAPNPFDDLPPYRTATFVQSVTPEMHWFVGTFLNVEWAGCKVGIPVDDLDGEPVVACWFPAGNGPADPPDDPALKPYYRRARELIRAHEPGASGLHVAYLGAWREVAVVDLVPQGPPQDRHGRMYVSGREVYALAGGALEPRYVGMEALGGTGLACYSDRECPDDPVWVDAPAPPELEGTSILTGAREGADPRYAAADVALRAAVLRAVAAADAGRPTSPPVASDPDQLLPPHLVPAVRWTVQGYGRSRLDAKGMPATPQVDDVIELTAPLDVARAERVTWTRRSEALDLTVRAWLDLRARRAGVEVTGPDGATAAVTERVVPDWQHDGDQWWLRGLTTWEPLDLAVSDGNPRLTLPGGDAFAVIDAYVGGPEQPRSPWAEGPAYGHEPTGATATSLPATWTAAIDGGALVLTASPHGTPPIEVPRDHVSWRVRVYADGTTAAPEGAPVDRPLSYEPITVDLGDRAAVVAARGAWVVSEVLDGDQVVASTASIVAP